jgi:hypothetical protein
VTAVRSAHGVVPRTDRDLSKVTIERLLSANSIGSTASLRRSILRKLATQRVWHASGGLPELADPAPGERVVLERDAPVQLLTTSGPEGGLAAL